MQQIFGKDLFIHHVPGRLRLRAPWLLIDPAEAAASAVPGVTSVKANSLTGSVTLSYDPARVSLAELWAQLQAGLGAPLANIPCPGTVSTPRAVVADGPDWVDRIADAVSNKLAGWVAEFVAERSATAFVSLVL